MESIRKLNNINDDFFKNVLELSSNGYVCCKIICDQQNNPVDYEYLAMNGVFEEFSGLKASEVIGKKGSEIIQESQNGEHDWNKFYGEIGIYGGRKEMEQFSQHLNRWYRIALYSPQKCYFVCSITDITQEKKNLHEKEVILTALNDIVFELDKDFMFSKVYISNENLLFTARQRIIGSKINDIFPQEIADLFISQMEQVRITGKKQTIMYKSPLAFDNNWYRADICYSVTNLKGKYIVCISDISEQKKLQDDLAYQIKELEGFFSVNLDLLCIADLESNFIRVNKAWEEILGYSTGDLENRSFVEFIHPEDVEATLHALSTLGRQEKVLNFVNRYRSKNGFYRYIEWRSHPAGNLIYATGRDVTQRIEMEAKLKENEARLELFFQQSLSGFFFMMLDEPLEWNNRIDKEKTLDYIFAHQRVTKVNQAMLNQYRLKEEELLGLTPNDMFAHDLEEGRRVWRDFFDQGQLHVDTREQRTDGTQMWIEGDYICLYDKKGRIIGHFGNQQDVTLRKEAEKLLKASQLRYDQLAERSRSVTWEVDTKGCYTFISPVSELVFGYKPEQMIDKMYFYDLCYDQETSNNLRVSVLEKQREITDFELKLRNKDNGVVWGLTNAFPVLDANGDTIAYKGIYIDITYLKESQDKIKYLSFHDQLTGLYNRRFFEEEIKRLDAKENYPLSLVMIDANGLKLINDTFGHKAGDLVLKKIAEILKREFRSDDVIARVGGDEFVILLPNTDSAAVEKIIERVKKAASKEKVEGIEVSVAYGWDTKSDPYTHIDDVFKRADTKMYSQKNSERLQIRTQSIERIIQILFNKAPLEENHAKRVSQISVNIGQELGLSEVEINKLKMSGFFHDIGKIAINEEILNKKIVDKDDWKEYRRHSEIGYSILSSANKYVGIAEEVLYHHEYYNGEGYPEGLKGEEIPLNSRIIAIANHYDALLKGRFYKEAIEAAEAIEVIKKEAGKKFDPNIVEAFLKVALSPGL